jgi:hypothetical protein
MCRSQDRLSKQLSKNNNQTGPVDQDIDENYNSRNPKERMSIKISSSTSKNKHMRHSTVNDLGNTTGSFIRSSASKSPRCNLKTSYIKSMHARKSSKNRV